MIPKIIHYCWFGRGEVPQLAKDCIASWHKYMPEWEYIIWNEDNFDISIIPYVKEAYDAKKYAFVSDYVRLYALMNYGGLYMDVDFEVFKSFDDLLAYHAFAGFEGSKTSPVMMGVVASEANGMWVKQQLDRYSGRHFALPDGSYDYTTNVRFVTDNMIENGFRSNGEEQQYLDLHVFPVDYFCPRQTTGEYIRTENTYCEHKGLMSWSERHESLLLRCVGPKMRIALIKFKRRIFG